MLEDEAEPTVRLALPFAEPAAVLAEVEVEVEVKVEACRLAFPPAASPLMSAARAATPFASDGLASCSLISPPAVPTPAAFFPFAFFLFLPPLAAVDDDDADEKKR